MKKIKNILLFFAMGTLFLSSCNDYLNVQPDNRVMIDTPEKAKQLLINAYPTSNYALLTEFSSDNIIDNNAANSTGLYIAPYDRMDDDIFAWNDPRQSASTGDTPYELWEQYYQSIAAANAALQAIGEMKQKGVTDVMLDKCKGEALILRAYSHFMLVNIFSKAYKDAQKSQSDLGVMYVSEPIDVVTFKSKRNSVAEVYDLIAKDIEEGIGLISDDLYKVPKYHFNVNAAHAFAAQFYLFKRDYPKVIEHANAVFGADPSAMLRNWTATYQNAEQEAYAYMSADETANFLILPTYSVFWRRFINTRYGYKGSARNGNIDDSGPTWSGRAPFANGWMWAFSNGQYSSFMAKVLEQFEYTDRVAGIGYPHIVRCEYTADALLLDRAEAYIFLNQIDNAVADLQAWNKSHRSANIIPAELTATIIRNFYIPSRQYFSFPFNTEKLSPQFTVSAGQKPFVDCVLHFRRLERVFEGQRWFDLKRYGIEITHVIGLEATSVTLPYDDDRRAIQIPSDAVGAGVTPNPRQAVPAASMAGMVQVNDTPDDSN